MKDNKQFCEQLKSQADVKIGQIKLLEGEIEQRERGIKNIGTQIRQIHKAKEEIVRRMRNNDCY